MAASTGMRRVLLQGRAAARASSLASAPSRRLSATGRRFEQDEEAEGGSAIPVRRALMYLPGHDTRKTAKAAKLNLDCVCLDLEDAVAPSRKADARETIISSLQTVDFGRADRAVRINPVTSPFFEDDMRALFAAPVFPDTIVVPKLDTVAQLDQLFELTEELRNKETPQMRLLTQVESPLSLLNLQAIIEYDLNPDTESLTFNFEGLIFGGDDFTAALGARRTSNNRELLYARQAVVVHAKAYGMQAIDVVNINFKDEHKVFAEAREGADFGFTGKQVIHPMQVPLVQAAFTPTEAELSRAISIINAQNEHAHALAGDGEGGEAAGDAVGLAGAFAFQGEMIDAPTIRQCNNVLKMARIDGTLDESRLLSFGTKEGSGSGSG